MNNYIEYIKSGLGIPPEPNQFRKSAAAPFLLVLLVGLIPGIVLGKYWLYISITMAFTSFVIAVCIFILSLLKLTIKRRLILQIIIYSDWVLQITLLETMFFTMAYGFNIFILFVYLPTILVPVLLGIKNFMTLKEERFNGKNNLVRTKINVSAGVTGVAGIAGIAGMVIAKTFFKNASQDTVIILVLLCFMFINAVFSVGLLSVQRLFFLLKMEKQGIHFDISEV